MEIIEPTKDEMDAWRHHPVTAYFREMVRKDLSEAVRQYGVDIRGGNINAIALDATYRDGFITGAGAFFKEVLNYEYHLELKEEDLHD